MFNDRDIANLALEMTKHQIEDLTKAGMESTGNLKQALIQMRNQCEQSQDRLGQMAIAKGWYLPAAEANHQDVQTVANFHNAPATQPTFRI